MTQDRRVRKRQRNNAAQALRAQRAALIAEQAAIRAEEVAEEQAPRQQRVAVVAADGTVVREPTAEPDRKRGGYRRANTLLRMHNGNPRLVTQLHLRAAARLVRDYEVGILGAKMSGGSLDRVDGATGGDVSQRQLDAATAYRAACDAMGPSLRTVVQWVVLRDWRMPEVGRVLDVTEGAAQGYLVAGLDALADHYWPDRQPRVAVDPMVVDAGVTDVPQERLGRGRKAA